MEREKDEQDGLPDIYLSPSRLPERDKEVTRTSSDTDQNIWDDTDSETWIALVPELTTTQEFHSNQERSMEQCRGTFSLGVREEIEGVSSQDSSAAGNNIVLDRNPTLYGEMSTTNEVDRLPEGNRDTGGSVPQSGETVGRRNELVPASGVLECSGQRGETPGSDCPPVAGTGAFSRAFRQPLKLDTNFPVTSKSELIFSPGGDEGFMVPGGVHAYYGSGSDTEPLEWADGGEGSTEALAPFRDAVEGADSGTPSIQVYLGNVTPSGLQDMERNSPAGLSTPDADIDLTVTAGSRSINKKLKNSIRPPVVGQSEELLVQASRKDLGSTDGEESENENQKRITTKTTADPYSTPEAQPGSLGSQSENTDSVNTVLDMSRGEIQGCETDDTIDTPLLSPSLVSDCSTLQPCPKPAFVVGGLISPRGKFRQFQNTVRDRMQDVKASLEQQPGIDSPVHVGRDQFLSQPPLYPPITPVSEQEVSLASMISVESTNHPDSSERVTSPSVLSVSSAASSRKMEWDSGADVGYSGNLAGSTQEHLVTSLSTLERIAIGNYASVLRTEPEGTTQVKEKQKISKKNGKSLGTKGGNNSSTSRQTVTEGVTPSPSRSLRVHQARDMGNLSSSDEDFGSKLSSPAQSPRRKLRRRSALTTTKDIDSPSKRMSKGHQIPNKRLREVMQELHNEGKSSSLVELATTSLKVPQYRRSSSQQSLSLLQGMSESNVNAESSMGVAAGTASSVATTMYQNNKSEHFPAASSIPNISTSTSTLVQSMSPIPLAGVSASSSTNLGGEMLNQQDREKKDNQKFLNEDARHSSQSSLPYDRENHAHFPGRTWTSSGNDVSSKSHDSSDMETPSDMKDTDVDSYTSHQFSDEEPVNLKARKNSENAKNHENIAKKCSRSGGESVDHSRWRDNNDSNSCSSSLQLAAQRGSPQDAESVLESQVSLQSSNNALQALSVKLKERIQVLLDNGSLKKVQDYNKLQDYIQFIGVPSTNEEECRLKQGVASVIVRMFGEIGLEDTDTSNTLNSETSDFLTTDSQMSDQRPHTTSEHTTVSQEDLDVPLTKGMLEAKDSGQSGGQERYITPGSTINVVPYRPPSATRTYFMAVSHEHDAGLVEGEHTVSPDRRSPVVLVLGSELEVSRGQAEGQREEGKVSTSPPTPPVHHLPDGDNDSNFDCNSEGSMSPVVEAAATKQVGTTAKNQTEDDFESASVAATLPQDWGVNLQVGKSQGTSSAIATSDECSPRHVSHRSTWDRRSSWHDEDLGEGYRGSVNWWPATTRSERLYKDKRGTLHVANQPPGYMDDRDSHPSESMSDHEHHHHHINDTESQEDVRRGSARPWTSSGSESAYETIRERHRHVDEALASSFEFYSTSPRDARLLGYVSSDAGRDQGQEEEQQLPREGSPEPAPPSSPPLSEQLAASRPGRPKRHHLLRWQQQQQLVDRQNSSPSSQTDGNDVSSQVSFIQVQKQLYVRKIQRHIHTLEKLERALLEQLGDSVGSENSFRRHVTEGRSHTESDTNGKSQTRDILGQSETATSSIISSAYSDETTQKQPYQFCRKGRVSKNKVIESKPVVQESPSLSIESIKSTTGHSLMGQSHTPSPRVTLSQLSSDLTNSQTSTLKQIEEEVRKLAVTEEKSRNIMKNSRLRPQAPSRGEQNFQDAIMKMRREEPRGEEDPVQSQLANRRSISDNNLDSNLLVKGRISKEYTMLDNKGIPSNRNSNRQLTQAFVISEEELTDRAISDSQISRQGDGREARDRNQAIKVSSLVPKGDDARTTSPQPPPGRDRNGQRQKDPLRIKLSKDFGQMFPSTENVLYSEGEGKSESDLFGHSIGVQTGDSLLYLDRSARKSKVSCSSLPSSATVSERNYVSVSSALSRTKRTSRPGSGRDKDMDKPSEVMSSRNNYVTTSKQSKKQSPRPGSGKDGNRSSRKLIDKPTASDNKQFDGKNSGSSWANVRKKERGHRRGIETTTKPKTERNRKNPTKGHQSASSSRVGSARDEKRHPREHKPGTSPRPGSGRYENRYKRDERAVVSSRSGSMRHVKEGRSVTSSMPRSARSVKSVTEEFETQSSSNSGSTSENKLMGNDGDEDSSRPESARSEYHFSSESTSSQEESARNRTGYIDGCSSESASKTIPVKEHQYTGSARTVLTPRQHDDGDEWHAQNQVTHHSSRPESQGEGHRLTTDQGSIMSPVNEHTGERAIESTQLEHNGPPVFIISPGSYSEGVGKQIKLTSKSISGSLRKFNRVNKILEPPIGTSSARSEGSDTLRNDNKNQATYVYDSQKPLDNSNSIGDLRSETEMPRRKNKAMIETGCGKTNDRQRMIDKLYKNPVRFDVHHNNKENFHHMQPKKKKNYANITGFKGQLENSKETLTLQEALARARPDYIREASDRRALIRLKREMRQEAQNHNHQIVAQIPANLQTPSTLQRFLYKPDVAPLFSYKDLREQNRRLYQLLPEANIPGIKQQLTAQNRTNRLMGQLYSKRLRKKVISGQVSHAHKEIVTPLVSRVRYRD